MSNPPLISIVIPTYNRENLLTRAIQSVVEQTYTNWEIIVVDNYSSDNTDDVIKNFADERIKLLKIHNNGIIAASRNMGIKASIGEWVAFLDSDDWWTNDKLQVCKDAINDEVDLIYHYLGIVGITPRYLRKNLVKTPQVKRPVIIDLLVNGNRINNSSVLVRKKLLIEIGLISEDVRIVASEDYHTWLRIAELTDNFICLPLKLGFYHVHGGNISSASKKDMSLTDRIVVDSFSNLLNYRQMLEIEARFKYASGRFHYFNGSFHLGMIDLFFVILHHKDITYRIKAAISLLNLIIFKFIHHKIRINIVK